MEDYNNYISLKRAIAALVNETSVIELSIGEFTANELRLARGIQAGFNVDDSGLSSGSFTRTDYNYGLAIKLVEDGTPELVVDEQLRRYAFAVASVRGNSNYKLGIHFDQTQLEFAEAVADSLSNTLYTQLLWTPADITSTLVWLDATDTATFTTNSSGRLVWLDKSPSGFNATETVENGDVVSTPNFIELQGNSYIYLPSPVSLRSMFFVTNKCEGSPTSRIVSALAGEDIAGESEVNHVFIRTDDVKIYDVSIDGGKGSAGLARINGEQGTGTDITIPNILPYRVRPIEATYVQYDESLNYQLIANMRNPVGFYPLIGDVGQVMFFSTVLSSDEIERLEGYYRAIYGYTLPPAHPFATHPYVYPLTIEAENFTNSHDTTPPAPANIITFEESDITPYAGQDENSTFTISANKQEIDIQGNGWKKYPLDYDITNKTILEFEFQSIIRGEIQGIGFDTDNNFSGSTDNKLLFQLEGSQDVGVGAYKDDVTGAGWQTYKIEVGTEFTGNINYLTFVNDHDGGDRDAHSQYRNISVYEAADEWMEYEVDIKVAGNYKVTSVVSSGSDEPAPYNLQFSANGTTATCTFSPIDWETYQNIDSDTNITLVEGKQLIRATIINGSFNFDKFILTKV